jgi:hypothetical protein
VSFVAITLCVASQRLLMLDDDDDDDDLQKLLTYFCA